MPDLHAVVAAARRPHRVSPGPPPPPPPPISSKTCRRTPTPPGLGSFNLSANSIPISLAWRVGRGYWLVRPPPLAGACRAGVDSVDSVTRTATVNNNCPSAPPARPNHLFNRSDTVTDCPPCARPSGLAAAPRVALFPSCRIDPFPIPSRRPVPVRPVATGYTFSPHRIKGEPG